jgi:uncharacterized membrane protein
VLHQMFLTVVISVAPSRLTHEVLQKLLLFPIIFLAPNQEATKWGQIFSQFIVYFIIFFGAILLLWAFDIGPNPTPPHPTPSLCIDEILS